jgi:hypothetical protein
VEVTLNPPGQAAGEGLPADMTVVENVAGKGVT